MQFTKNVSLYRLVTETVDQVFINHREYDALNFVDYELLPHLNKMESSFLQKVREYSERINYDIISIADGAALFYINDDFKCVGKAIKFHSGVMMSLSMET